jgi:uncharacterized membrane protein YphA (DoxX/SURF4 family)
MDGIGHELWAVLSVAGRVCVGLVFVLAAVQKAQHWKLLSGVISNYRLLPRFAVPAVSALLPPVELTVGLLLLSAQAMPWAQFVAMALLVLFAAAMAINIRRGRSSIDCGCGQSFLKQSLRWSLVARNGALALLLLPSFSIPALPMSLVLSGVAGGLAFFLLTLVLNTLSALPPVEVRRHRFA